MKTSQGAIFSVFYNINFVTKFCNFTNFNKFCTGIYFFFLDQKLVYNMQVVYCLVGMVRNQ